MRQHGSIKLICFTAGVIVLAVMAHKTISTTTGYDNPDAYVTMASAMVVAVLAVLVGSYLWRMSKILAVAAICVLISGDLYQLARTVDQEMQARSERQAPAAAKKAARSKAQQRLNDAIAARKTAGQAERQDLQAAQVEYARLNEKATSAAPGRTCGVSCRTLHAQSTERAAKAVDEAKEALASAVAKADQNILRLRAELDTLPVPSDVSTAAAFIGIAPVEFNATLAGLKATSMNFGAIVLLAIAGHGLGAQASTATAIVRRENDQDHVGQFALVSYMPMPEFSTHMSDMHDAYKRWCRHTQQAPLTESDFYDTMARLAQGAGLKVESGVIHGMAPAAVANKPIPIKRRTLNVPQIAHKNKSAA